MNQLQHTRNQCSRNLSVVVLMMLILDMTSLLNKMVLDFLKAEILANVQHLMHFRIMTKKHLKNESFLPKKKHTHEKSWK